MRRKANAMLTLRQLEDELLGTLPVRCSPTSEPRRERVEQVLDDLLRDDAVRRQQEEAEERARFQFD